MYALIRRAPFAAVPIDEVRRRDFKTLLKAMDVGPATTNRRLSACRQVFKWAMELDYVENDPTHGIRREKEPPPRETRLNKTQARRFLELAQDPEVVTIGDAQAFHGAVLLALYGAFRKSNYLGMRWAWRFAGAIHVPADYAKSAKRIVVREAPPLTAALEALRATQDPDEEFAFPARRKSTTGHVSDLWFRRRFRLVLKALRKEDFTVPADLWIHDFRTTAASLMRGQGVPMSEVSEVLGHSDERITATRYAFLDDHEKGAAAARLVI